ncbi:MAG: flagellar hook basal-body protein [Gluconacetobacter diazotrophicus]|nr:flagellar hook basal-body protein [Gluconacetobacter diazotrophicus]
MSVFSALDTAVSGLASQSHAFTDIGNNIANSQTTGYKSTNTTFADYVLNSSSLEGNSATTVARTQQNTQAQGTITASTNALALAISGNGFFNVVQSSSNSGGTTTFNNTQLYTRDGNFTENNQGYLVNDAGNYLEGYVSDANGNLQTDAPRPINVANIAYRPAPTDAPGAAAPNFTGVSMTSDGSVMASFDNGKTQMVARIPLASFADANALNAVNGQAYSATNASGAASMGYADSGVNGGLETSSIEGSTTNLDSDLTKLIVAQQAYGANAKVVSTANEMLQTTLAMKQ